MTIQVQLLSTAVPKPLFVFESFLEGWPATVVCVGCFFFFLILQMTLFYNLGSKLVLEHFISSTTIVSKTCF